MICIVLENVGLIVGMVLIIECVINDKLEFEVVGGGYMFYGGGMLGMM